METVKKLRWTPDVIHCQGWMTAVAPLYIKKAYNDDPFFKRSKVVYSLFDDEFKSPFNADFGKKLMLEGIEPRDIESVSGEVIDYEAVSRLAIDFSDGVIQSHKTVKPELVEYTKSKGIKFLPFVDTEDYVDEYIKFYDSL